MKRRLHTLLVFAHLAHTSASTLRISMKISTGQTTPKLLTNFILNTLPHISVGQRFSANSMQHALRTPTAFAQEQYLKAQFVLSNLKTAAMRTYAGCGKNQLKTNPNQQLQTSKRRFKYFRKEKKHSNF